MLTCKELFAARAHLGHKTSKWNPKMFPYILKQYDGKHIIDLTKTRELLYGACEFIEALNSKKSTSTFLFVGTKPQAAEITLKEAGKCRSFYVNYRWLGGMLTNWATLQTSIQRLHELEQKEADGTLDDLPKKEESRIRNQLTRLRKYFTGIKDMPNLPDAIIIIDPTFEMTAVREAIGSKIPIIALIDTNGDPTIVDYPIPCNGDSILTISAILSQIGNSISASKPIKVKQIES